MMVLMTASSSSMESACKKRHLLSSGATSVALRIAAIFCAVLMQGCSGTTKSQEFYDALMSEDERRMESMLARGVDVNTTRLDGWRPLPFSIANRKRVAVEWLLENGADIESEDGGGNRPLFWAVRMKDDHTMDLLLKAGADPCGAGRGGESAMQMAKAYGDLARVRRLGTCKQSD